MKSDEGPDASRPLTIPPLAAERRDQLRGRAVDSTATWRNEALDEYVRLRTELDGIPSMVRDENQVDFKAAEDALDAALIALAPTTLEDWRDRSTKHPWWQWCWEAVRASITGTRPDEAWSALHDADEAMLMLYDELALRRQASRLERALFSHIDRASHHFNEYHTLIHTLRDAKAEIDDTVRLAVRDMLESAHAASDRDQRRLRALRNQMLAACFAIGGLLLFAAAAHAINTDIFSVCAGKSASLQGDLCPDGTSSPDGFDVFGVQLAGALGGLLSAVVPFVSGQLVTGRYRLALTQIWLKVQVGALTGFLGVLLLESGLLPGFAVQQGSKIYGYAAFFGFAQQLLTGMIDRRVNTVAKEAQSTSSATPGPPHAGMQGA